MIIYFSAKQNSFFNDDFHGARLISIPDPNWQAPMVEISNPEWSEGAEGIPETIWVEDFEAKAPQIDVLDESASAPMVDAQNPKCLLPPESELVMISAEEHAVIFNAIATSNVVLSSDNKGRPVTISAPGQTPQQILAGALSQRDRLITLAATRIAPLQDAVDLDDATEGDVANLKKWKQYRVAVNRVPDQAGFPNEIVWPVEPL